MIIQNADREFLISKHHKRHQAYFGGKYQGNNWIASGNNVTGTIKNNISLTYKITLIDIYSEWKDKELDIIK